MISVRSLAVAVAACLFSTAAFAREAQPPKITINAPAAGDWKVIYELRAPARRLLFVQSPDASRVASWKVDPAWEIVSTKEGEVLQRKDGSSFTSATAEMAPVYRELPKSYAPFSPFGDGGMLFHTGRFFACAQRCPDNPNWDFNLHAAAGRGILINGERKQRHASWTDSDQGTNVYVGEARPVETAELLAIIDTSLPQLIRQQLVSKLPSYMRYFSERLGSLPQKPMLFASYDASDRERIGQQGGTLPGQVYTHFYGAAWPKKMERPELADELTWFFAHEAAHLYQRQIFGRSAEDAWIHEGGAEVLATLASADISGSNAVLARNLETATKRCAEQLDGRPLKAVLAAGVSDASYSCGLVVNLSLDRELRSKNTASDGIYGLWRQYIADVSAGAAPGETSFLKAIEKSGGQDLARKVEAAVSAGTSVEALGLAQLQS